MCDEWTRIENNNTLESRIIKNHLITKFYLYFTNRTGVNKTCDLVNLEQLLFLYIDCVSLLVM